MTRIARSLTAVMLALASGGVCPPALAQQSASAQVFERMKSLVGAWKGVQPDGEFEATYTLTANGSVLMEEFRPKNGATMVTMFSVDGDRLIATHYCSVRNQPQVVTAPLTDPGATRLAFSLARVTGMRSPDDWHNTGLVVTLGDGNAFTQEWTYRQKDERGKNVFRFTRVSPGR
jgi:hypothetical protein